MPQLVESGATAVSTEQDLAGKVVWPGRTQVLG
jgi:hypothetical protein